MYKLSPFLHICMQWSVRELYLCKICAKKMYNLSHIISSEEEGLNGDLLPAQILSGHAAGNPGAAAAGGVSRGLLAVWIGRPH